MTSYSLRPARVEEAETVKKIVDAHEASVDPSFTPISVEECVELVEGFVDPGEAVFLIDTETDEPAAFYSLSPDANRNRMTVDIYASPDSNLHLQVFLESLKHSASFKPEFDLWYGVSRKDKVLKDNFEKHGFSVLRTYWTMHLSFSEKPELKPTDPAIELRKIETDEQIFTWWQLHQDAFSTHFGFAPRAFENWKELVLGSKTLDSERCFIAYKEGNPAGFVEMANANYQLNGSYVNVLGVSKEFQGQGIGKALLSFVIQDSLNSGREFIELNVDTGNTSGALRLYESLGFKVKNAWEQYENKDWVSVARSL